MELLLKRGKSSSKSTIGELYLDGVFECYTLEDVVREIPGQPVDQWKVYGETAIPSGRYKIIINHSTTFNQILPLLLDVPGFKGIRIHKGNWAKNTLGCILPGTGKTADMVTNSAKAFDRLFAKLKASKTDIYITIVNA